MKLHEADEIVSSKTNYVKGANEAKEQCMHCSPVPNIENTSQILVVNVNMSCPRKREKLARATVSTLNRYFI